ncbi:MAG: 50S ribosomal protein L18 [Vampirovibrionales bacterium]
MYKQINRKEIVRKRHQRIRKRLSGCADMPRLAVYRSNKHISVQLIDDVAMVTLAAASTQEKDLRSASGANVEAAKAVGKLIAERALALGVQTVVFDRGGNLYHGRVAAVADAAREAGLFF